MSANNAVLVTDDGLNDLDSAGVATLLAAAVKKAGEGGTPVDMVLAGRQAADIEHGQTGSMIAEALSWPALTFISKIKVTGDVVEAQREVEDGYLTIQTKAPFVATITNDATNQPRLAKVRDVMMSNRAKIPVYSIADLGVAPDALTPRTRITNLDVVKRESHVEMIEGETAADKADALAARLRELKLV